MNEVKRKRGRPRKYETKEECQKAYRQGVKNITIPRSVAGLIWDCVAIKSQEIGVQLTTTQVIEILVKGWIAKHDPDGSKLKASTFKRGRANNE